MSGEDNRPLCVVFPDERGFWAVNVYIDGFQEDTNPDWYATSKNGDDQYEIMTAASREYPGVEFAAGITGVCTECGEEHYALETECSECGLNSVGEP
jgi:hypothetical protein